MHILQTLNLDFIRQMGPMQDMTTIQRLVIMLQAQAILLDLRSELGLQSGRDMAIRNGTTNAVEGMIVKAVAVAVHHQILMTPTSKRAKFLKNERGIPFLIHTTFSLGLHMIIEFTKN